MTFLFQMDLPQNFQTIRRKISLSVAVNSIVKMNIYGDVKGISYFPFAILNVNNILISNGDTIKFISFDTEFYSLLIWYNVSYI